MNPPSGPVRVVVVDDSGELRLVVRQVLEASPSFLVVGEAGDGAEALDVAAATQPDLILLDLDMPGVGGIESIPRLRARVEAAKIVVLSGLPRGAMEPLATAAGAVGFLEKGIPSRRLIDELIALAGLLETVEQALAEARVTLEGTPEAPGMARRFVDDTLDRWECGEILDTVKLLVSELVTNALIHARTDAAVAVVLLRDVIRVEVADGSPVRPQPRSPEPHEPNGRGLQLVERMASAWGVTERQPGKVVWFEVPRLDTGADIVIR
jgi:DNA-binding NarL/FixJ family response regulator